jgi:putative pseudouridine transporter
MTGLKIAAGVATVVMAFVAIIALLNGIIGGMGGWFGYGHATLEGIFGFLLAPLAWIMGVDWSDATLAGSLIGQKLAINEFVAYLNFSPYLQAGGNAGRENRCDHLVRAVRFRQLWLDWRGCRGVFGHFTAARAGNRPAWAARPGGGTLSNLMSATIAGFFIGLA